MEAKNFRIGNWVNGEYRGFSKDVQIYGMDEKDIQHTRESVQPLPSDSFKPIPLTKEWLDNFGFDDSEYIKGYTGVQFRSNMILDFVLTKPKHMGEWQEDYHFELREHRIVPVKYVHQLQNLFFAITGQELELKNECSTCG